MEPASLCNENLCTHVFTLTVTLSTLIPSQDRPWEVTPGRASLQTLQKVGLACEQAYQLCIPEKCSMLNWLAWKRKNRKIYKEKTMTSARCVLTRLWRLKCRRTKGNLSEHYITITGPRNERYCRLRE